MSERLTRPQRELLTALCEDGAVLGARSITDDNLYVFTPTQKVSNEVFNIAYLRGWVRWDHSGYYITDVGRRALEGYPEVNDD